MVRQLLKLLSSAVVFVSALIGAASVPAAADGAWACGGEVNVGVDARLVADGSGPASVEVALPATLQPGVYAVRVKTVDNGPVDLVELNEQVVVVAGGSTLGPTPDLDDTTAWVFSVVGVGQFEKTASTTSVTVRHAAVGASSPEDVTVTCLGFTYVGPPTVVVDLTATPGTDCATGEVVVDLVNAGDSGVATVSVGGDVQQVTVAMGASARTVHALAEGTYPVTVEIHGTTVLTDSIQFTCDSDPGDGGPGDGGPGDGGPGDGGPGDGGPDDGGSGDGDPDDGDPGDGDPDDGGSGDGDPDDGDPAGDPVDGGPGSGDGGEDGTPDDETPEPGVVVPLPVLTPDAVALLDLEIELACAAQAVDVRVANTGDLAGRATLALARSTTTTTVAVDPASSSQLRLPLPETFEGAEAEVVLVRDDGTVVSRSIDVDCLADADPVAEVIVDCAARELHVVVSNDGEEPTEVQIFEESVALVAQQRLAGGAAERATVPIDAAEIAVRVVTTDGTDVLRETVTPGCVETDVVPEFSLVCPSLELELQLENLVDDVRVAVVAFGAEAQAVELVGGSTTTISRAVGTPVRLTVTSIFGDLLLDEMIEPWSCGDLADPAADCVASDTTSWRLVEGDDRPLCPDVTVRLVLDCLAGATMLEILNGTDERVVVETEVDGSPVGARTIAATQRERWDLTADPTSRVVVRRVQPAEVLLDARVGCAPDDDRTGAVLGGLLVALMSIVAAVVARFDPWMRV
ncbi:MAG: hypothetical protein AAF081_03155 [Actinomycetota bacterium]